MINYYYSEHITKTHIKKMAYETCEDKGHRIIDNCGKWCVTCKDFPKIRLIKISKKK